MEEVWGKCIQSKTMVLNSVISGKNDFCCLCLKPIQGEPIDIGDEIAVNINGTVQSTDISEVIKSIFGAEFYNSFADICECLCEKCTKSAISAYGFIQECIKNSEYLSNIITCLHSSFDNTIDKLCDGKSTLYVALNIDDLSSTQYFDPNARVTSTREALKRFHSVVRMTKLKQNTAKYLRKKKLKTGNKNGAGIPLCDILLDSNNPESLICKECLREFLKFSDLLTHYKTTHVSNLVECSECPKKFTLLTHLNNHKIKEHHPLACYQCGKIYTNRNSLRNHELGHNPRSLFVCEDCGRVYKSRNSYNRHIEVNVCGRETRARPSEAKLTCDYCDKKYSQKVTLRVHIQHAHGSYNNHICEWCGKNFWSASRLRAHIVKHTQEKNFVCTICDRKFVTRESLLYHTRLHTGEKPYKCPHCDSSFLSSSRRSSHIKRHHSQKGDYECDICGSKFTSILFLQKHKKIHHNTVVSTDEKHSNKTVSDLHMYVARRCSESGDDQDFDCGL